MPKTKRDDTLWTPAGDLRHTVTLRDNSTGSVDFGTRGEATYGSTHEWTARALVETLGGYEGMLVRQNFPTASHRVTLRYDSRLTVRSRILFGNTTLHVVGIIDVDNRNRDQIVVCGSEV
jgi:head-tail adaptor